MKKSCFAIVLLVILLPACASNKSVDPVGKENSANNPTESAQKPPNSRDSKDEYSY
jgi:hypothetical protein